MSLSYDSSRILKPRIIDHSRPIYMLTAAGRGQTKGLTGKTGQMSKTVAFRFNFGKTTVWGLAPPPFNAKKKSMNFETIINWQAKKKKKRNRIAATRLDRVTSGLWAPRATSCAMLLDGRPFKTGHYNYESRYIYMN